MDSVVRIFASVLLLDVGFSGELAGALAIMAVVFGVILLLTGVVGFCPLYALFSFNSQKSKSSTEGARTQLFYCA